MGSLVLIDVYQKSIEDKQFLVAVVYSLKAKSINRIYKKFDQEEFDKLEDLIGEDVSSSITPKLKADGTAGLDIQV